VDVSDYMWNMYNEHTSQGRHREAQRTAVSTVVLALAGAVVAVIAQGHFRHICSLAAFLILLGLVGALFSQKQAERTRMHITIAGEFRHQLERSLASRGPPARPRGDDIADQLKDVGSKARQKHRGNWNWKTGRDDKLAAQPRDPLFPLYWFFIVLNLLVSILGVAILVIAP
jgi:Flp pilus assembly protein TadB